MKKKILISTVVAIMLMSMTLMLFAGCDKGYQGDDKGIGLTKPTEEMLGITPTAITQDMTAYQMMDIAIDNFYNADYIINEYVGGVNMKLAGIIKVDQVVQSTKIREGKGDKSGNNANGATYFADNKSHSAFAKIYEKFVITENSWTRKSGNKDKISYTKPGKKGAGRLGAWKVTKWNSENKYNSLKELADKNYNNPTILWMYDLSEENIKTTTVPAYDEVAGTYKFTMTFKPMESTVEYRKVMLNQLESNAGMPIENLGFNELKLEFVLWDNGMIKSINVTENYQMKMMLAGTGINSAVILTAKQSFSYDRNEKGYNIDDHLEGYKKNTTYPSL